jgi:tRNA A37 threonylcarbamoyladenosine dehydratase
VGEITLVDLDDVCISNVNRQLPALEGNLGKAKVEVLADRARAINPEARVHALQTFFVESNSRQILETRYDCVVDAIDSLSLKALLIAMCRERALPIVVTGGAGGRRDPTQIEVTDLAFSSHCALLQEVRRTLRRAHGFPRGDTSFDVDAVFSREARVFPQADGSVCKARPDDPDLRLDCNSGLGTASFVTGTFGFVAASCAVRRIIEAPPIVKNSHGARAALTA